MAKAKKKVAKKQTTKKKSPLKAAKAVKKTAKKAIPKKGTPKKKVAVKKASKSQKTKPTKAKSAKKPAPKVAAPSKKVRQSSLVDFVTPLDDRLIVRLKEADRRTSGGLFIPDTVADLSGNLEGTVVAVGRGHRDNKGRVRPMDVKAGDRVLFSEYTGSKIRLMDEDFVILREGDLAGILS